MEALTRLVADSLARHGLDRPVDPRRLQWSRWFRCDSPHSLLVVPSKPGIFAIAEEIMDLPAGRPANFLQDDPSGLTPDAGRRTPELRRMLAVLQFSEDDDMAFTLDRMFTQLNPMRSRLSSGRCFLRFVVIEDQAQRRSICNALNQWMLSSAEKVSGLPSDFQSSLELTDVAEENARVGTPGRTLPSTGSEQALSLSKGQALSASADSSPNAAKATKPGREMDAISHVAHLDSGAAKNLHCPQPLPSGF
jgi:hypothetical protein